MRTVLVSPSALGWGVLTPHTSKGTSAAKVSLLFLNCHTVGVGPVHSVFYTSYQFYHSFFFIFLVTDLCSASLQVVLSDGSSII